MFYVKTIFYFRTNSNTRVSIFKCKIDHFEYHRQVGINVLFHIYQSVAHHNIMHLLLCVSQLFNVIRQLKDINLQTLGCGDDCGIDLPEGLLILYRSGIFVMDTSVVNCQICPRHRDDLGICWKRQKQGFKDFFIIGGTS